MIMEKRNFINILSIREIIHIIIGAIFLGLILAVKIKWPILSIEPLEFFSMFGLSILMLGVFVASQKFIAVKLDFSIKSKLLSFRRFWFHPLAERRKAEFPFDFPLWLALPLFLILITGGFFRWLAIFDFDIEPLALRVRRRWKDLTEEDIAKVAIAGPMGVLILGIISRIIGQALIIPGFNNFALICVWFSLIAFIPIGSSFKLLMGSRILVVFGFILTLIMLLIMNITGIFATLIVALIFAALATLCYYILYER